MKLLCWSVCVIVLVGGASAQLNPFAGLVTVFREIFRRRPTSTSSVAMSTMELALASLQSQMQESFNQAFAAQQPETITLEKTVTETMPAKTVTETETTTKIRYRTETETSIKRTTMTAFISNDAAGNTIELEPQTVTVTHYPEDEEVQTVTEIVTVGGGEVQKIVETVTVNAGPGEPVTVTSTFTTVLDNMSQGIPMVAGTTMCPICLMTMSEEDYNLLFEGMPPPENLRFPPVMKTVSLMKPFNVVKRRPEIESSGGGREDATTYNF